jgi:hypothetical protein
MRGFWALILIPLIFLWSPAGAQSGKFVARFSDWSAYVSDSPTNKVCFAISQPKDSKPKNVKRGPIYFYISHWPVDKVRNEISVKIGYPFKANASSEVTIGTNRFKLFTKDEGAFVESVDTEQRLIDAMKTGSTMVITGRSARGTLTTDRYSLNGISAVLDKINTECP